MSTSTSFKTRIAAATALIALTAASAASAATVRPTSLAAAQARFAAAASTQLTPNSTLVYKQIDDPLDKTFNQLLGIDDNGVITGYFGSSAVGRPNTGYTIAPPYSTFVPDNLPSSTQTQATGTASHNGWTTGFWAPTNLGPGLDTNFGFIRVPNGHNAPLWLSVNDPNVSSSPKVNQVLGINQSLNAVGFYNDVANNSHGYVYSEPTGTFIEPFHDASAVSNAVTGINDANAICGFFTDTKTHTKGFIQLANGQGVHYEAPGSTFTQFLGINNANEAVGFYNDINNIAHGIIYQFNASNPAKSVVTFVNVSKFGTVLNGINNKHEAVGFFADGKVTLNIANQHGLLVSNVP